MEYLYYSLASAIIFSLTILLVKYISKYIITDFNSFFFWTYVAGLPFIFLIPLRFGLAFTIPIILLMVVHSILLTFGQYLFSKGIYLVDTSVVSPLFQLQTGFILILATLFLNERYAPFIYGYLFLLIIGTIFVSVTDKTKLRGFLHKGVLYIIGMQLFHAGANIAVGFALKHTNSWQTLFYSFLFNSILVTGYIFTKKAKVTFEFSKIKWMLLRSFLLFSATALLYKAFETNVSISAAIGLLSSPIVFSTSVLLAFVFPNLLEKQSLKTYATRAIGMVLIIFGAWNIMMLR